MKIESVSPKLNLVVAISEDEGENLDEFRDFLAALEKEFTPNKVELRSIDIKNKKLGIYVGDGEKLTMFLVESELDDGGKSGPSNVEGLFTNAKQAFDVALALERRSHSTLAVWVSAIHVGGGGGYRKIRVRNQAGEMALPAGVVLRG